MSIFHLVNSLTSLYAPQEVGACYEGDNFLAYLSARDPENQPVTYYLIDGILPLGLSLDPRTGAIAGVPSLASLGSNGALMHDNTWTFTAGAYDGTNPPQNDPQQFSITVKHIPLAPVWPPGENGLLFVLWEGDNITNATIINAQAVSIAGGGIQLAGAPDPQGLPVTYGIQSGLPTGISISSTGLFQGALPSLSQNYIPLSGTTFNFIIDATNGLKTSVQNCSIHVNNVNVPPVWVTPAGNLGSYPEFSSMSFQLVATDIDGNPLTFSLTGGSFESGVTMNSSGLISGTPVNPTQGQNNTCNFQVTVTNGTYSVARSFSITFTNVNLPPVWVSPSEGASLFTQNGGTTFSVNFVATDPQSYHLTYSVTSGALPGGLSLNASTGLLSGLLTPVGSDTNYSFTITVNDGFLTASRDFTATVKNVPDQAPQWVTAAGTISSGLGGAISFQFQATDPDSGPQPLSYFVASGSLPGGVSLSSTGRLSGTVPANNTSQSIDYQFTVGVTDGDIEVDRSFTITVLPTSHGSQEFTANGSFVVPPNVTLLNFTWIIGGGGAGGCGQERGNGGGGGGGGGGGLYQNFSLNVVPGDSIGVTIGAGGLPQLPNNGTYDWVTNPQLYDGLPGGDTIIKKNGTEVVRGTGGSGGQCNRNTGVGFIAALGGAGGNPNGSSGQPGAAGTNDFASAAGGNGGGNSSLSGAGGNGGAAGAQLPGDPGSGYGAGGGGGGSTDRTAPYIWSGGNGISGYVLMTW